MAENTVRLTDAQIEEFKEFCDKWATLLNVRDWRIVVREHDKKSPNLARVDYYCDDALAYINLYRQVPLYAATSDYLEFIAVHELLHIFLHRITRYAPEKNKYLPGDEHAIICVLIRLLLPQNNGSF